MWRLSPITEYRGAGISSYKLRSVCAEEMKS